MLQLELSSLLCLNDLSTLLRLTISASKLDILLGYLLLFTNQAKSVTLSKHSLFPVRYKSWMLRPKRLGDVTHTVLYPWAKPYIVTKVVYVESKLISFFISESGLVLVDWLLLIQDACVQWMNPRRAIRWRKSLTPLSHPYCSHQAQTKFAIGTKKFLLCFLGFELGDVEMYENWGWGLQVWLYKCSPVSIVDV